jgi:tRNA pseudouridine38-40 synthase
MYLMRKIRLLLEYDGTAYHGWQVQKEDLTIQSIIEEKVSQVTGTPSSVIGASRTDAGVHAFGQVAVFRTESQLAAATIKRALNAVLPKDIRVLAATEVGSSFHPREDALKKRYVYMIANQRVSSVFLYRYTWIVPQILDINVMEKASRVLIGKHDFSAFMGTGSDVKDTVREIYSLDVEKLDTVDFMTVCLKGTFIRITIEANGFLRHMVRNIVGTLIEIGRGRIPSVKIKEILESHDRKQAGQTAPPNGLFLERIDYPKSVDIVRKIT